METDPKYVVIGPGPLIVDTRYYSVSYYGSLPDNYPAWLADNSLPKGRVELTDAPIPSRPTDKLDSEDVGTI